MTLLFYPQAAFFIEFGLRACTVNYDLRGDLVGFSISEMIL